MPWHIRQHRSSIVALWQLRTMAMFINPNKHFGPANARKTFVTTSLCISLYFLWSVFPRGSHGWSLATAVEWQRHLALRVHTHRDAQTQRDNHAVIQQTKALSLKKSDTSSVGSPCPLRVKRRVNSIMLGIFRPTPDKHDWKGQYIGRTLN